MKLVSTLVLAAAMTACTTPQSSAPASPRPTSQAPSQASDLRTHLDLLLAEQVMIVAKESAAAVNHSDEYTAYTSLLATNSADVTSLFSRAFGNTSAVQFAQLWNSQNGFLVDYAIGVVTHNDDKAKAAMDSLTLTVAPQLARLVSGASGLTEDPLAQLLNHQVALDKSLIDDVAAGSFQAYYTDLHRAYAHTARLGDVLAVQTANRFPDRFPGDASAGAVDARVALNNLLQEHSYLATMATDATVNGRDAERGGALIALAGNADSITAVVGDTRFALAWSQEGLALASYAQKGDTASREALTGGAAVAQLAAASKASVAAVARHEIAVARVVDDQRAKSKTVADDDRAAATSMQPIADYSAEAISSSPVAASSAFNTSGGLMRTARVPAVNSSSPRSNAD